MKLREKQMADRRRRILDAAEELIRQTGGADFSMLALPPPPAGSPATPYNPLCSPARLPFAPVHPPLTELPVKDLTTSYTDPLERLLETTRVIATHLATHADFFRPLFLSLWEVQDDVYRPEFVEYHLRRWERALADVERAGLLSSAVTA